MIATPRPFVLVTGLSGAGKASILRVLEDLGFETVDNPPLAILDALVREGTGPMAAGIDTRTRGFDPIATLAAIADLRERPGIATSLVFATAEDEVLQRRYTETRRRHPMAPGGTQGSRVQDGITREAAILAPLREAADLLLDTSNLPLPELRRVIEARFMTEDGPGLNISLKSFGFPKGLPREADLVFDMRFLANPHYDAALRPLTGRDQAVADHVAADPDFLPFWTRLVGFIEPLLPCYVAEGKKYLTIAIGCTGGRHRSVFVVEKLAAHLRLQGWRVDVAHRELGQTPDMMLSTAPPEISRAGFSSGPPAPSMPIPVNSET